MICGSVIPLKIERFPPPPYKSLEMSSMHTHNCSCKVIIHMTVMNMYNLLLSTELNFSRKNEHYA